MVDETTTYVPFFTIIYTDFRKRRESILWQWRFKYWFSEFI